MNAIRNPRALTQPAACNRRSKTLDNFCWSRLALGLALAVCEMRAAQADPLWVGGVDGNVANAANWANGSPTAGTVAQFGTGSTTQLSLAGTNLAVKGIVFGTTAPAYTLTLLSSGSPGQALTIGAGGIQNQSTQLQRIVASGLNSTIALTGSNAQIQGNIEIDNLNVFTATTFSNGASAGEVTIVNQSGGITTFDRASAGQAKITAGLNSRVVFAGGSTAQSARINVQTNGTAIFNDTSSAGNATLLNLGTLAFAGTSSAGLARINNAAVLAFGNEASAGSARIINAGGTIQFTGIADARDAQIANSAGALIDISGSSADSVAIGSLTGQGAVALGTSALVLGDANQDDVLSGVVSGSSGQLVKEGSGTLTLGGANSYGGATRVAAGVLDLQGSIAGDLAVASGATANGNGIVGGNLLVGAGGTVAALSPGVGLRIHGSINLAPQSIFVTQISGASAAGLLSSTGQAQVGGAQVRVNALGQPSSYVAGTTYTLLSASAGVIGQFASVQSNLTTLIPGLRYLPNAVELVLEPAVLAGAGPGASPNQLGTAGAVAGIGGLVIPLKGLAPTALGEALASLDASPYAATRRWGLWEDGQFSREIAARSLQAALAHTTSSAWLDLIGQGEQAKGDRSAAGYRTQGQGLLGGVGLVQSETMRLGLSGELVRTRLGFDGQRASGQSDATQVGVTLGERVAAVDLTGVLAYRNENIVINRSLDVPGLTGTATAHTSQTGLSGLLQLDWPWGTPAAAISPYGAFQWIDSGGGGFAERGVALADLSGKSENLNLAITSLGVSLARTQSVPFLFAPLKLEASLAWLHQVGAVNPSVVAIFEASPTTISFSSKGPHVPADGALLTAGARAELSRSLDVESRLSWQNYGRIREEYAYVGLRYFW